VNIEIIEEFLHLSSGDMKLDFGQPSPTTSSHIGQSRRISTRGADKGVKDDFKQMMRQQIGRSRDDIDQLIINFIQQEHVKLINCAVETIDLSNPL
jgi:integrator complex subunit 10